MTTKRIAIITGASGGLGKAFIKQLITKDVNEIWCIARDLTKLNDLKNEFGAKIFPISLDLSEMHAILTLSKQLELQKPNILYLINNAGIGDIIIPSQNIEPMKIRTTIDLNCTAIVLLCNICLKYMSKGSKILNISSQASFQPLPYVNLYAATKAFVTSYTRALNVELQKTGITATAVCPGWIDTNLLPKFSNKIKIKYPNIIQPEPVAIKALKDADNCKDLSVITNYVKWMQLLTKIFSHKMVMKIWVRSIKKYL